MSTVSKIALVLASATRDAALDTMAASIEALVDRYRFDYRSYGSNLHMEFKGIELLSAESTPRTVDTVERINRAKLAELAAKQQWFGLLGSVLIPGFDDLVDAEVLMVPSGDSSRPCSIVFHFPTDLYLRVWKEGEDFDADAAEVVLRLCIAAGTSGGSEGFEADLFEDIDGVPRRNSSELVKFVTDARSANSPDVKTGFLIGFRRSLLSAEELEQVRSTWKRDWVDTTNGFVVLSSLRPRRTMRV